MENQIQCEDQHLVETFHGKPRLIGITGKAGAGKDTIGEYLEMMHSYRRISFAQPIRNAISGMFDLSPEWFQHPLKEQPLPNIGKSPRQLMQWLGTEWGRNLVHPDLWLILARESIEAAWTLDINVVVTDVRFENEATMIRELGGQVWHVERDGSGTPHQHASEAGVSKTVGDLEIDNNGTIGELWDLIEARMNT